MTRIATFVVLLVGCGNADTGTADMRAAVRVDMDIVVSGDMQNDLATHDLAAAVDMLPNDDVATPPDPDLAPPDLKTPPDLVEPPDLMCIAIRSNCDGTSLTSGCCAGLVCGFPSTGIQPQKVCCTPTAGTCTLSSECCTDPQFGGQVCMNGKCTLQ